MSAYTGHTKSNVQVNNAVQAQDVPTNASVQAALLADLHDTKNRLSTCQLENVHLVHKLNDVHKALLQAEEYAKASRKEYAFMQNHLTVAHEKVAKAQEEASKAQEMAAVELLKTQEYSKQLAYYSEQSQQHQEKILQIEKDAQERICQVEQQKEEAERQAVERIMKVEQEAQEALRKATHAEEKAKEDREDANNVVKQMQERVQAAIHEADSKLQEAQKIHAEAQQLEHTARELQIGMEMKITELQAAQQACQAKSEQLDEDRRQWLSRKGAEEAAATEAHQKITEERSQLDTLKKQLESKAIEAERAHDANLAEMARLDSL